MISYPFAISAVPSSPDYVPNEWLLARDEVHVWIACLRGAHGFMFQAKYILSSDEQYRAAQFHFVRDRDQFVNARALVRTILGGYLGVEPKSLTFRYSSTGKPALTGRWSGAIEFNLSHSREGVLCAVSRNRRVGVDLEFIRPMDDIDAIARQILSPDEHRVFNGAAPEQQVRLFYEFWTRKEAFVKATGRGLSFPVQSIDVRLRQNQQTRMLASCDVAREKKSNWMLYALMPGATYAAALVAEGEQGVVTCLRWPSDVPRPT